MNCFQEIIEAARQGHANALQVLIQRYQYIVEAECFRLQNLFGADTSQADLQQEVWLRVWSRIDQFDGQAAETDQESIFKGWLRRTARHVVINQAKKRNARKRGPRNQKSLDKLIGEPAGTGSTASHVASRHEQQNHLIQALARIEDPLVRTIIEARFFEGQTMVEISERLGLSYEQTRYRFNLGLSLLKDSLPE